ncbi:MAG: FHA domain-containing protein [Muribaculaceae bacterium]|nr:FHA domain-containing protein [Muribaculaceae bacterium]
MKTITLGKAGDQPFKIKGIGVSKIHATVTIDDYGRWILADSNSTNGTFVRNEMSGELMRVGPQGMQISEMTFIVLGEDSSAGCCFYAKQLVNPGDYVDEHLYMRNKKLEFDMEEEKVAKNAKWVRIIIFAIMLVFTIGTIIWQILDDSATKMMFNFYRGISLLTMGATTFYDAQGKRAKIVKKRKLFSQCPNPECDRKLTNDEIENLKCGRCQK